MRERLRDHHPGAPSCSVVPGGVDVERFAPIDGPGPETFAEDETSFLTVRRLTPRMGLETLLDAFASVVADGDDAHLYVGATARCATNCTSEPPVSVSTRPSRSSDTFRRSNWRPCTPARTCSFCRRSNSRVRARDARGAGRRDARDRDASRRDAGNSRKSGASIGDHGAAAGRRGRCRRPGRATGFVGASGRGGTYECGWSLPVLRDR